MTLRTNINDLPARYQQQVRNKLKVSEIKLSVKANTEFIEQGKYLKKDTLSSKKDNANGCVSKIQQKLWDSLCHLDGAVL